MVKSGIGLVKSGLVILNSGMALLLCAGAALAQGSADFIARCDDCTKQAHYAFAAASKVPGPSPYFRTTLTWTVYVANIAHNHLEAFQVVVQPLGNGGDSPPELPGKDGVSYEFGAYKTAWPVDGDPQVKAAVLDGISIALDFSASLDGSLDGARFTDVDSAISLVGPEGSPAGLARLQLRSDLGDHCSSVWLSSLSGTGDLAGGVAQKFLGEGLLENSRGLIEFEDGTSIEVQIESVSPELNGLGIFVDFEVLTHTALLPDGTVVPQSAGEFSGYNWNDGAGGTNVGAQLASLAALYGLEVGEPGDGLDCKFDCEGNRCNLSCSF